MLIRFDEDMRFLWYDTYGTNRDEFRPALAVCSDGGFALAGCTEFPPTLEREVQTDVLLVRIDENGNQLWNQTLGGIGSEWLAGITQCDDDGFAIAGCTGSYGDGLWLLKTDSMGTPEWNYTYGGFDRAVDLIETNSGFLLVGMRSLVCTDTDGTLLWNRTYGEFDLPISCLATHSGYYLICGNRGDVPYSSIWLRCITPNGVVLWEKSAGVVGVQGRGIVECHDGGFAIVGNYTSPGYSTDSNICITRIDAQGNTLWSRNHGFSDYYGPVVASPAAILQLADGSFLLAGSFQSPSEDKMGFILRFNDIPIMHYIITQAFLAGFIISIPMIIILTVILAYRFIKRRNTTQY